MNPRRLWLAFALLLLTLAAAGRAADKDTYGDTLPDGAKARIGTARMRNLSGVQLAPDGKSFYAQAPTGLVRFDPATGATLAKPVQLFGTLAAFSADGKRAAHVTYDRLVVWDTDTGATLTKLERRLPGSESQAPAALSADGKVLAVGGTGDRAKKMPVTVLVWDTTKDKQIASIAVAQNDSASVALTADGKTLATWGVHYDPNAKFGEADDGPGRYVNFWDAAAGKELAKFRAPGYAPSAVAFAPDGALAAVAGNTTVELVDPKTGASKQQLLGRTGMGRFLAFSPDGATLAATGDDGAVQRWRVADGARLSTTEAPTVSVSYTRVRLLDNERGIAWGTKGNTTVVWEVPSGKYIGPEGGHSYGVRGVAVTSDNKHVLTSADDGTTRRWELATGKPAGEVALRRTSGGLYSYAPAAVLSVGAARALSSDSSGGIGVHDLGTGTQQYVIPVSRDGFSLGSFSADGAKIVVAASSNDAKKAPSRVTVWDADTGKKLGALELPGYAQVSAALTPDGKHLVTAGFKPGEKGRGDFVFTGWELATGAKKGELAEGDGYASPYVVAAPDNKTAVATTIQGKVVAFDLLTGAKGKVYDTKGSAAALAPVFSPDGKRLAFAGRPTTFGMTPTAPVLVFDFASGDVLHTFTSPGQPPTAMAFSPDGKWLVTGAPDTTATVWDVSK